MRPLEFKNEQYCAYVSSKDSSSGSTTLLLTIPFKTWQIQDHQLQSKIWLKEVCIHAMAEMVVGYMKGSVLLLLRFVHPNMAYLSRTDGRQKFEKIEIDQNLYHIA